jgi:hypothetical protein
MKTIIYKIAVFAIILSRFNSASAQAFLNGDFENNTAVIGTDQINLSNANFNANMPSTFAFGTYGDMDIINTTTYSGGPQKGNWFVAFTGGGTDIISMELTSELIKGKQYTISFWDKAGSGFIAQPFQIGVSDAKDAFGTIVYTCSELPKSGEWTKRTFTFTTPLSGKYITVQLAGAANIGDWAQADNFSFGNNENSLAIGNISEGPYCACSLMQVPFTGTGSFSNENQFTAQLSDKNGDFKNAVTIGTLTGSINAGIITCDIPCDAVTSSKYRIRVVSSEPALTANDNGNNITINAVTNQTLIFKVLPSNVIKEGQLVTFRPSIDNKSSVISWQWKVNGTSVSNTETFSSTSLGDGDVVNLTVLVENSCSGKQTIVSQDIVMNVLQNLYPSVSIEDISSSGPGTGKQMTFKANPENEGRNPVYQWMVNGNKAGTNFSVFSSKTLKDGDKVSLTMITEGDGMGFSKTNSNIIEVSLPAKDLKQDLSKEKDKKEVKNYASGVMRHKAKIWGKKGKRFVKVGGITLRKLKKAGSVCYKD